MFAPAKFDQSEFLLLFLVNLDRHIGEISKPKHFRKRKKKVDRKKVCHGFHVLLFHYKIQTIGILEKSQSLGMKDRRERLDVVLLVEGFMDLDISFELFILTNFSLTVTR